MKKDELNNYPEGFLEEFKEPVTFKLLGILGDEASPVKGWKEIPAAKIIPATSTVLYTDKNGDVQSVTIGLVKSTLPNGDVEFNWQDIMFGYSNDGQVQLNPSIPSHRAIFNYLNHCEHNYDSPYTRPDAKHLIYRFSLERMAKEKTQGRKSFVAAIKAIAENAEKPQAIENAYKMLGKTNTKSIDVMINELEELASTSPNKVLDVFAKVQKEDPFGKSLVLIQNALGNGNLKKSSGQLKFNNSEGGTVYQYLKKAEGGDPEDQLANAMVEDKELYLLVEALAK